MLPTTIRRKNYATPSIFDDYFNDSFLNRAYSSNGLQASSSTAAVNVEETEKDYRIELAAPGVNKEDLKVSVKEGILTISYEKKEENEEEKNNYTRREFSYNSFSRSFSLPDETDAENVVAKHKNGILTVSVPKVEVKVQPTKEVKIS